MSNSEDPESGTASKDRTQDRSSFVMQSSTQSPSSNPADSPAGANSNRHSSAKQGSASTSGRSSRSRSSRKANNGPSKDLPEESSESMELLLPSLSEILARPVGSSDVSMEAPARNVDVKCNGCNASIPSHRFYCLDCPTKKNREYNLCLACYSCKRATKHRERHAFVVWGQREIEENDPVRPHPGAACNGCGSAPIHGPRFWCTDCPARKDRHYNLCLECFVCNRARRHRDRHSFALVNEHLKHDPNRASKEGPARASRTKAARRKVADDGFCEDTVETYTAAAKAGAGGAAGPPRAPATPEPHPSMSLRHIPSNARSTPGMTTTTTTATATAPRAASSTAPTANRVPRTAAAPSPARVPASPAPHAVSSPAPRVAYSSPYAASPYVCASASSGSASGSGFMSGSGTRPVAYAQPVAAPTYYSMSGSGSGYAYPAYRTAYMAYQVPRQYAPVPVSPFRPSPMRRRPWGR